MGFNFGIILGAIKVAAGIANLFRGPDGEKPKPQFQDIWPDATANVMKAVQQAVNYGGLDSKEKLDAWLAQADSTLGNELTAIDVIPGLPPDKEEELSDHLIEAARIYGYMLLGLPGYKTE